MDGVLCTTLLYTSLILGTQNQVTLDFSTPQFVNPNGVLICFDDPTFWFTSSSSARVVSLSSWTDIYSNADPIIDPASPNWNQSSFFDSVQTWGLDPVTATTAGAVLGTDPYYSTSYSVSRYDDLDKDEIGQPIGSNVIELPTLANATGGNCFLITGAWSARTAYLLTLEFTNPPAPASSSGNVRVAAPGIWMVPLSYSSAAASSQPGLGSIDFSVRGSKQGQMCAAVTSPAGPVSTCASGEVLSPLYGGTCVACNDGGTVGAAGNCTCAPGFVPSLVPGQACVRISVTGAATSAAALAAELCAGFTGAYKALMQGQLSDRVVLTLYLEAFVHKAAYLTDWAAVLAANGTFADSYIDDQRNTVSPTRKHGLKPNCNRCTNGSFQDIYTGVMVPLEDNRFDAVNTLRLIGYVLNVAGYSCTSLFDAANPTAWLYGEYNNIMCSPL